MMSRLDIALAPPFPNNDNMARLRTTPDLAEFGSWLTLSGGGGGGGLSNTVCALCKVKSARREGLKQIFRYQATQETLAM